MRTGSLFLEESLVILVELLLVLLRSLFANQSQSWILRYRGLWCFRQARPRLLGRVERHGEGFRDCCGECPQRAASQ